MAWATVRVVRVLIEGIPACRRFTFFLPGFCLQDVPYYIGSDVCRWLRFASLRDFYRAALRDGVKVGFALLFFAFGHGSSSCERTRRS